MPTKAELLEKVKALPAAFLKIFKKENDSSAQSTRAENDSGVTRTFNSLSDKLGGFFTDAAQFLGRKLPGKKERLICAVLAGVFVVLLFGAVFIAARLPAGIGRGVTRNTGAESRASGPAQNVIPGEDIFLPDEPDFVPGIMLERERRTSWTAEDARRFWHDPLKNGEEQWRQQLEAEIDTLLERVP